MPIISFVQTKGGTGKSTLALCTAASKTFNRKYGNVALVELDTQGTLADWMGERIAAKRTTRKLSYYHLAGMDTSSLTTQFESIAASHECILIDVPGESTGGFATKLALNLSHLVAIPMRTTTNDEASFGRNLWPVIQQSLQLNQAEFAIIPTFVHPQANRQNVQSYFQQIMPPQVHCLPQVMPTRAPFENFNRDGMTLEEYVRSVRSNSRLFRQAQKAAADVEAIAREIIQQIR